MHDEQLTAEQMAAWEERVRRFGLHPARHGRGKLRVVTVSDIDELKTMVGAPVLAEQRPSIAPSGPAVRQAHDITLRDAIVDHVLGTAEITDPDARDEIARRFPEIAIEVTNAPDRPVTADNPLIINAQNTGANFGTVTIQQGGYIMISVPCYFKAVRLIKTGSGPPPVGADVVITGTQGKLGTTGPTGPTPDPAQGGASGECDCCGGIAVKNGTAGSPGGPGGRGVDGGPGGPGGKGPSVVIDIDQLASNVTLLNIGGRGGDGGPGGPGGKGGDGGPGGSQKQCGAEFCDGGNGGPGGPGGNGGTGGAAGDGGPGGTSTVYFRTPNGSDVIVTNGIADPGTPGCGGGVGVGGGGGKSGGRGANPGTTGNAGTIPGGTGATASPGSAGSVQRNPPVTS
jgi:hypothetical protein